jgi:cell division protein FtsA
MILTGGTSSLPGIRSIASHVLGVPVRIAKPENLVGMVDKLETPAFSTSVGLLRWGMLMNEYAPDGVAHHHRSSRLGTDAAMVNWEKLKGWMRRLLP